MAESKIFSVRRFLVLMIPVAILVAVGAGYLKSLEPKAFPYSAKMKAFLQNGLIVPTKLDDGLTDEDGNLVADPPPANEQLDPQTLVFAVLGSQLDREQKEYADLVQHLEKTTGKKVELVLAED